MKKKFVYLLALMLGVVWQTANAQNITLQGSTKTLVEVGEQFRVVYEVNGEGSSFVGPDFKGFSVLTGPMVSTSSSIQVINGKVDRTFSQTYTYIIAANSEGDFKLEPATVSVDGKKYTSNRLQIKVVASSNVQQGAGNVKQSSPQNQTTAGGKDLYLKAIPDKKRVVAGEQVIVTYRIYTRVPIASLTVTKLSSFPGFWTKNLLDEKTGLQQSTQIIDGEEYVIADVRKVALFPQKTGTLSIEPMELECVAQIRGQNRQRSRDPFESFFNDPFFNPNIQNVQKSLVSETVSIDVEPLPASKRPAQFKGAVGQFGFQSAIDRNEINANEAINISYTISGTGNLELVDLPKSVFPTDFEVYEPKISTDIKTSHNGVSGSRKTEFLLIPRFAGNYKIAPIDFVYFDPRKNEYITLQSQAFDLKVNKGTGNASQEAGQTTAQEGIRYIGSDIRHIKLNDKRLQLKDSYFFASTAYFLIIFGSLILFVFAIIWSLKQEKLRQNQSLLKNRKATKVAKKRLVNAQLYLKKKEQSAFYTEMSQALWGYLADKFMIPRSELSIETVQIVLSAKNAPTELVELFILALNNCEYARFAPGDAGKKMDELYQQGIDVISQTERLVK